METVGFGDKNSNFQVYYDFMIGLCPTINFVWINDLGFEILCIIMV